MLGSCRPRIDRQLGEVSLRDGRPALWTSGAREGRRESVLPCSLFQSGAWRAPEGEPPLLRRASKVRRQGSEGEAAGRAPWNAIEPTGDVPGLAVGCTEFRRKRLGHLLSGRGQLAARNPSWLAGRETRRPAVYMVPNRSAQWARPEECTGGAVSVRLGHGPQSGAGLVEGNLKSERRRGVATCRRVPGRSVQVSASGCRQSNVRPGRVRLRRTGMAAGR